MPRYTIITSTLLLLHLEESLNPLANLGMNQWIIELQFYN